MRFLNSLIYIIELKVYLFIKKNDNTRKRGRKGKNAILIKNEKVLIDILSTRTYQQRQKIMAIFNKTYNKDIIQELQKYFSGNQVSMNSSMPYTLLKT